jgi:TolA-binding protein
MTIANEDLYDVLRRIERRLVTIQASVLAMEEDMTVQLDALRAEVEQSRTVTEGAAALLGGLADQIRALKDDPAQLEALATQLDQQTTVLANAMESVPPSPPAPPAA